MINPKPCPFCGSVAVAIVDGSTFRWRAAMCSECEARGPEVRIQTAGEGGNEAWEIQAEADAITQWSHRKAEGELSASIAAIHCLLSHGPLISTATKLTILDECEHCIPALAKLRKEGNPFNPGQLGE